MLAERIHQLQKAAAARARSSDAVTPASMPASSNNDASIAHASTSNNTMTMMGNNDASVVRASTYNTMTMANNDSSDTRHNNSITINATTTALRNQVRFPREIRAKSSSEDSSDSDDEVIADTLE